MCVNVCVNVCVCVWHSKQHRLAFVNAFDVFAFIVRFSDVEGLDVVHALNEHMGEQCEKKPQEI